MKRIACVLVLLSLSACRTFDGLGEDLERIGRNLSDRAEKIEDALSQND